MSIPSIIIYRHFFSENFTLFKIFNGEKGGDLPIMAMSQVWAFWVNYITKNRRCEMRDVIKSKHGKVKYQGYT
jgi:hypothetical protein